MWDTELQRMVLRGIPYFTLFRFDGRFPFISDRALSPLRAIERRRAPRVPPNVFEDTGVLVHRASGQGRPGSGAGK